VTDLTTSDPWPFERLAVVSFVPVRLHPQHRPHPPGGEKVTLSKTVPIDGGRDDVRELVLQEGQRARPGELPRWYGGPVPLTVRRCVTRDSEYECFSDTASRDERARHISPPLCEVLHDLSRRAHRAAVEDDQYAAYRGGAAADLGVTVEALEVLRFDDVGDVNGLLMIHAEIDPTARRKLAGLGLLTGRRPTGADGPGTAGWVDHLLRGVGASARGSRRAFHLCFARPTGDLPRLHFPTSDTSDWEPSEQWRWTLSTAQDGEDYPPSARNLEQVLDATRPLSNDWAITMMRGGTTFLTRPLETEWRLDPRTGRRRLEYLAELAPLLVRSIYADALALSYWKGLRLQLFANELAELGDPVERPAQLRVLEADFTRFRNRVWWDDTGLSGHATMMLRMHRDAHGQQRQFDRLVSDFADYSQKVERLQIQRSSDLSQETNALVGLFAFFGVPLATLQVFGTSDLWVWAAIFGFVATLGLAPAGREIVTRSLQLAWSTFSQRKRWVFVGVWVAFWALVFGLLELVDVIPTSGDTPTR
jgi:hypothetical protein